MKRLDPCRLGDFMDTTPAAAGGLLEELAGPVPLPAETLPSTSSATQAGSAMAAAQLAAWRTHPAQCTTLVQTARLRWRQGLADPSATLMPLLASRAFRAWIERSGAAWANTPDLRSAFLETYVQQLTS